MRRIDELFAIERTINGKPPDERRAVRQERSKPLVVALEACLREQRAPSRRKRNRQGDQLHPQSLGGVHPLPRRWAHLSCRTTPPNAPLRGVAIGRRNWTFAGSDEGGRRAAAVYTLIETCKLNDVDPQAWLDARTEAGHWEGDLIICRRHTAPRSVVHERKSRVTLAARLMRQDRRRSHIGHARRLRTASHPRCASPSLLIMIQLSPSTGLLQDHARHDHLVL